MNKLLRMQRILNWFRFQVVVENWKDSDVIIHYGRDWSDALNWARCYPPEVTVSINRMGKRVAMVGQR
jgi:hypothetical protein